jgi:hypothetical protein
MSEKRETKGSRSIWGVWGAILALGVGIPSAFFEHAVGRVNTHLTDVDQAYFRKVEAFTKARLPQVDLARLPAAWSMLSIDQICKVPEMRRTFEATRDCGFIPSLREMMQARDFLLGAMALGGSFALIWGALRGVLRRRLILLSKNGSVEQWLTQAFSGVLALAGFVVLMTTYRLLSLHSAHYGLELLELRLSCLAALILLPMFVSVGLTRSLQTLFPETT